MFIRGDLFDSCDVIKLLRVWVVYDQRAVFHLKA